MPEPQLSIVIAESQAAATLVKCLSALQRQVDHAAVEVLVVSGSTDGTAQRIREGFPFVKWIPCPGKTLIPELWGFGIRQARGDIIAVTTAHCVPDAHWVAEILRAHRSDYAAVGGAIENRPSAGLVDWAVYFCRYSEYMLPFAARPVAEVAGDNASYKRSALRGCEALMRAGFWEPFIHAELRKRGLPLFADPAIVVYHAQSFGFLAFLRQRFQHGRNFGRMRAAQMTRARRAQYILFGPAIPCVLLWRIARRVLRKKRHRGKWALSLPILIGFLLSWSTGEVAGYIAPQ